MSEHRDNHFPMPVGDPCYFCQIVEGASHQWQIVDQCESTTTLLNGRQFEIGQCIVIPKRHAPTLLDLTELEGAAILSAARKLTQALVDAYSPDGVLVYQNNGTGSGQEVPHFHLHVVPRQSGSDWGFGPPHLERLEKEGRLRHQDHLIETEEKIRSIQSIRQHLTKAGSGKF